MNDLEAILAAHNEAIEELTARIEALEARMSELE